MIAIDTTFFAHSEIQNKKLTYSTSIFTADLLDAFARLGFANQFCLIANFNHERFIRQRFPQYKVCIVKWCPVTLLYWLTKGKKTATKLIKKSGNYKRIVEKQDFDAIWFPYAMNQTFIKTKYKTFATIHDIYRIHNGIKKESDFFKEFILDTNTELICISDYTRQDILKTTGCTKTIPIIPNSVEFDISKQASITECSKKYILDINAYDSKKNTITLLKAYSLIKNKNEYDLVLCGGYKNEAYFSEITDFIHEHNLQNYVHVLFRIPEEQKNWLLANATLFITPSLFEGFGRTPVEAAICKIPVISTKETSLYEATKGLVNYVENPLDEKELTRLIEDVLKNYPTEEKLTMIATNLQQNYKADNCAKKYIEIFNIKNF